MLTVSRGRRFIGTVINVITVQGLIIGSTFLMLKKGQTFGGMIMGYRYESKGISVLARVWAGALISGFMYGLTFGIMAVIDCLTMPKRNGWLWEQWLSCKKTNAK